MALANFRPTGWTSRSFKRWKNLDERWTAPTARESEYDTIRNLLSTTTQLARLVDILDDPNELPLHRLIGNKAGVGEFVGKILGTSSRCQL
jgi:hypothetical protein